MRVRRFAKTDYYLRHVCLSACLPVCLSVCPIIRTLFSKILQFLKQFSKKYGGIMHATNDNVIRRV